MSIKSIQTSPFRPNSVVVSLIATLSDLGIAGTADPGGAAEGAILIAVYLVCLAGILIALLAASAMRWRIVRNCLATALTLGIAVPVGVVTYSSYRNNALNATLETGRQIAAADEAMRLQGLARYCDAQRLVVRSKPKLDVHEGLQITYGSNFTGQYDEIRMQWVADEFRKLRTNCATPTIAYIELLVAGKAERFQICQPSATIDTSAQPRFFLVMGESGKRDQLPWGPGGSKFVSQSSVSLRDTKSGAVLAEDTLVFQTFANTASCKEPTMQLHRLLSETFKQ